MTTLILTLIFSIAPDTLTGKVVRIADGDTVTILVGGDQVADESDNKKRQE